MAFKFVQDDRIDEQNISCHFHENQTSLAHFSKAKILIFSLNSATPKMCEKHLYELYFEKKAVEKQFTVTFHTLLV